MRNLILIIMTFGSLNAQDHFTQLMQQYENYREDSLTHRRFKHSDLLTLIEQLPEKGFSIQQLGSSYQGRPIYRISIGHGPIKVLMWSQMHGNEATATMALFDIFNYLGQKHEHINELLSQLSLHFIPMLNPDGAELFQRHTSQGIDMNRDALRLQCPESKILKDTRDQLVPDFGFNLHDQNLYYNVGTTSKPATISFLAPAYNQEKQVNEGRGNAMRVIVAMNEALQAIIPGQVGRYDDTFEPRAFGDNIQKWGTSTILIESGGFFEDPEKQFIRRLNFVAILTALYSIGSGEYKGKELSEYHSIPFNESNLNDLLIRGVTVKQAGTPYLLDIAIRREEQDVEGNPPLFYEGSIEDLGDLSTQFGYQEIEASGLAYAPGKLYPEILKDQRAVEHMGVDKLLRQGYTTIRLEQPPKPQDVTVPFDLVSHTEKAQPVLAINQRATFLLFEDEELSYVIINGFVCYNSQSKK